MRIKADLRALGQSQAVTSFTDKVFAGVSSFAVSNTNDFAVNDYILIGTLGLETTELAQISSVSGETFSIASVLVFDHPQDTQITNIGYNQIAFYRSSTVTGTLTQLGSNQAIKPDNFYNFYDDTNNSTGYGWFRFYNTTTTLYSDLSNAVPYAGFDENSVKKMLDSFFTQIGNRERKLISDEDAIRWLNEGYAIARNRLNLVNREYTVPTPMTITIGSGTAEYALPSTFSKSRVVTKNDGSIIPFLNYDEVPAYSNTTLPENQTLAVRYYLRAGYVGFAPTPSTSDTYFFYYQTVAPQLSTYIDYIDLPGLNYYFLLDFLLYRATPIIGGDAGGRLKVFQNGLDALAITQHKREGDPARFGIDSRAIV